VLHILSLAALVAFVDAERYSEVEQALMLESVMDRMGAAEEEVVVVVEYAEGLRCDRWKALGNGSLFYTLLLLWGAAESVLY